MTTVKSALLRHLTSPPSPTLGGNSTRASKQMLANDLLDVSRRNTIYFGVCFGAVLLALVAAAAITLRYLDSPDTIRAIFGVLGISVAGLTVQLASLWKQKVNADLLVVLTRNIDEEQLNRVLGVLLARL